MPEETTPTPEVKVDPKLTKEELENMQLKERLDAAKERADKLEELRKENESIKKNLLEMEKKELLADLVAKGQMSLEFAESWGKTQDMVALRKYQETSPVAPQNRPKPDDAHTTKIEDKTKWISSDTRLKNGSIAGLKRSEALQERLPYMLYQAGRQ